MAAKWLPTLRLTSHLNVHPRGRRFSLPTISSKAPDLSLILGSHKTWVLCSFLNESLSCSSWLHGVMRSEGGGCRKG